MPKSKPVRLFNGRFKRNVHIYIGANSVADAARILQAALNGGNGLRHEIEEYFSKDAWGTTMREIQPERGAWVRIGSTGKPIRVIDADGQRIEKHCQKIDNLPR